MPPFPTLLASLPLTSPDRLGPTGEWIVAGVGALLVLLAGLDLVIAVLSGGGQFGLYSGPLCRGIWSALRWVARHIPRTKNTTLNGAGSAMLVIVPACWVTLLILGFGLLVLPGLDGGFVSSGGQSVPPGSRHGITALYVSGYTLTTLGLGPFTPQSNAYRLLFVVEGAFGFAIFTLAITYLLSVLTALRRRNTFARQVHHLTDGTDDALPLLASLADDASLRRQVLLELALGLNDIHESYITYPVLHYFRRDEPHFSMSHLAAVTADLVSLGRAVTPANHPWHHSADARAAYAAAQSVLHDLSDRFLPTRLKPTPDDHMAANNIDRARLEEAARLIPGSNASDLDAACDRYAHLRSHWLPMARAFQRDMMFDLPPPDKPRA